MASHPTYGKPEGPRRPPVYRRVLWPRDLCFKELAPRVWGAEPLPGLRYYIMESKDGTHVLRVFCKITMGLDEQSETATYDEAVELAYNDFRMRKLVWFEDPKVRVMMALDLEPA